MGVRTICLEVAFDGSSFQGWQVQQSGRTVQGVLEGALEQMHRHSVRVIGAGRTDSGVHARGQCAHFITDITSIDAQRFVPALNRLLPGDVRVLNARDAGEGFHARYDAVSREYRYLITYGRPDPSDRTSLHLHYVPDVRLLNGYSRYILGTHDFTTFCAAGDTGDSRTRILYDASWYARSTQVVFRIRGNAFLWKMVRSLVGTMLVLERQQAPAVRMKEILDSRDRSKACTTAPAAGLHLWRIEYA